MLDTHTRIISVISKMYAKQEGNMLIILIASLFERIIIILWRDAVWDQRLPTFTQPYIFILVGLSKLHIFIFCLHLKWKKEKSVILMQQ